MGNVIRKIAIFYLVALACFAYGWLTVKLKVFPYGVVEPVYQEVYDFFSHSHKESVADMVKFDHQERENPFGFSGLKVEDPGFVDEGFLLLSGYSKKDGIAVVELFSLAENRVIHKWVPDLAGIFQRAPRFTSGINTRQAYRSQHPFLLDNGDLLITSGEGPLVRIDPCGNVVWLIERHFHHSIEQTADGNFLVPLVVRQGPNIDGIKIRDDGFALVSPEGKILREVALFDPMIRAGYRGLVYGVGTFEHDRFHLNDVQPVPGRPGKVLLSIRNLSSVAQMDLASGDIDWLKIGPWINQHDVNALAGGWVSVFGNDFVRGAWTFPQPGHSEVYLYHPDTKSVKRPYSSQLAKLRIHSEYEGRARVLANGDVFVEETNRDRLVRVSDSTVRWQFVNGVTPNSTGALHWSRYLEHHMISPTLLENLQCVRP